MFKDLHLVNRICLLLVSTFLGVAEANGLTLENRALYRRYFESTFRSLECLRGENGLINDRMTVDASAFVLPALPDAACKRRSTAATTSPTNIGFDLLSQIAALDLGYETATAKQNIAAIVDRIAELPRHTDTHLFYAFYSTNKDPRVLIRGLSSVDNIHLALALWTVARDFRTEPVGVKASVILKQMDFKSFFHPDTGLMGGYMEPDADGHWVLQKWNYQFFGSEARSIASIGYAIGLFDEKDFVQKSASSYDIEYFNWREDAAKPTRKILRTWDGGVFQLLLPQILIDEARYSDSLKSTFENFADFIVDKQTREKLPTPAAFSASQAGDEGISCGPTLGCYNGQAGILELVAAQHRAQDEPSLKAQWEAVFTPHALFLAATRKPDFYAGILKTLEQISDRTSTLYHSDLGWMDGYRLRGPYRDSVIPVQLALDQEMILLSTAAILSGDGLSPAARTLNTDASSSARLRAYYEALEARLNPVLAAGL